MLMNSCPCSKTQRDFLNVLMLNSPSFVCGRSPLIHMSSLSVRLTTDFYPKVVHLQKTAFLIDYKKLIFSEMELIFVTRQSYRFLRAYLRTTIEILLPRGTPNVIFQ